MTMYCLERKDHRSPPTGLLVQQQIVIIQYPQEATEWKIVPHHITQRPVRWQIRLIIPPHLIQNVTLRKLKVEVLGNDEVATLLVCGLIIWSKHTTATGLLRWIG